MHRLWPLGLTLLFACDSGARQDGAQAKADAPVAKAEVKAEVKAEPQPEAKAEVKAEPQPDAQPEAKADMDYNGTYTSGGATLTIRNFVADKGFDFSLAIGAGSGEDCEGVDYSGAVKFTEPNEATNKDAEDPLSEGDLFKLDGGRVHFEPSVEMIGMDCARQLDVEFSKPAP